MRGRARAPPPVVARPVVTYAIIGITALVYLLQWIPGLGVTNALFFSPVFMTELIPEPWRALTSVFLHSTALIFHIVLNMYTLWIFGRLLEPMLGRWRFLALYLLSGLGGSVGGRRASPLRTRRCSAHPARSSGCSAPSS